MLYEFCCAKHGTFDEYRKMSECTIPALCPKCRKESERIFSIPTIHIIQGAKTLPLGRGSPGRVITSKETGGMGVFIPSFGGLEQAEVDYIAEGAIEKEKSRVKKKTQRKTQAIVQAFANLANKTKRGQRAKVLREAIKGG